VIRYGIDVSCNAFVTGVNGLRILYQDRSRFVLVRLICADIDTGVESVLIRFVNRVNGSPPDAFQEKFTVLEGGGTPFSARSASGLLHRVGAICSSATQWSGSVSSGGCSDRAGVEGLNG
jgi:hypothetical protein